MQLNHVFKTCWQLYKKYFVKIFFLVICILIHNWIVKFLGQQEGYKSLTKLYWAISSGILTPYYLYFFLIVFREEKLQKRFTKDIFATLPMVFLIGLILSLITFGGILLFVIPGIIWFIKYHYAYLACLDKNYSIINSFKYSAKITNNYKLKISMLYLFIFFCSLMQFPLLYNFHVENRFSTIVSIANIVLYVISALIVMPFLTLADIAIYDTLSSKEFNEQ